MRLSKTLYQIVAAVICALPVGIVSGEGDLSRQAPVVVEVQVGGKDGTVWEPNAFELETGKLYQFIFKNGSDTQIDIEAAGLVERVFTRKVQTYAVIDGEMERTAEVKGMITAFEVFGGQQIDWWFVPVRTTRSPIKVCCTVEDDAVAATIVIK